MARPASQASPARKAKGGSALWLLGLLCGAIATLATPTAILLALALAPSAVVLAFDTRPQRPSLRPVMLAGLAATIHPVLALWRAGHTVGIVIAQLGDTTVLATAWAAQAGAWLLAEMAPVMIRVVLDGESLARAARLRSSRRDYERLWDIPPLADVSAAGEGNT